MKIAKWIGATAIVLLAVLMGVVLQRSQAPKAADSSYVDTVETSQVGEPISPIPILTRLDQAKVSLGERLFQETRLSHNNTISCASCHSLDTGGTDRLAFSHGLNGGATAVGAPSVFNAGFNIKQFWDGRAETLEDQIDGPTQDAIEMGSNWPEIISKLGREPYYAESFAKLYPDGVQSRNIKDAIAIFERSLSTPNARFDRYLRGDRAVLTSEEQQGYGLFKAFGCSSCHQGVGVGGNMFQRFGVMGDYFADRGHITRADLGRFNVTGIESDRFVFKVPSLRNVALTPPYFHDGSAARLEDAVKVMGKYQLGRHLSPEEIDHIVKFLNTLTGEYKGKAL